MFIIVLFLRPLSEIRIRNTNWYLVNFNSAAPLPVCALCSTCPRWGKGVTNRVKSYQECRWQHPRRDWTDGRQDATTRPNYRTRSSISGNARSWCHFWGRQHESVIGHIRGTPATVALYNKHRKCYEHPQQRTTNTEQLVICPLGGRISWTRLHQRHNERFDQGSAHYQCNGAQPIRLIWPIGNCHVMSTTCTVPLAKYNKLHQCIVHPCASALRFFAPHPSGDYFGWTIYYC